MYLHRILNLESSDPVYEAFVNLKAFAAAGEINWWTDVKEALRKFALPTDLEEIRTLGKEAFRKRVNESVTEVALNWLLSEAQSLKKTKNLQYKSLHLQEYLRCMFPNQSKLIFKARSRTLDIKEHRSYKYDNLVCRGCGFRRGTP